jgi:hypothetical protein
VYVVFLTPIYPALSPDLDLVTRSKPQAAISEIQSQRLQSLLSFTMQELSKAYLSVDIKSVWSKVFATRAGILPPFLQPYRISEISIVREEACDSGAPADTGTVETRIESISAHNSVLSTVPSTPAEILCEIFRWTLPAIDLSQGAKDAALVIAASGGGIRGASGVHVQGMRWACWALGLGLPRPLCVFDKQ